MRRSMWSLLVDRPADRHWLSDLCLGRAGSLATSTAPEPAAAATAPVSIATATGINLVENITDKFKCVHGERSADSVINCHCIDN